MVILVTHLSSSIVYRMGRSASEDVHNLTSVTYLLLPCGINPIIYGVRTKEMREHLLTLLKKEVWCQPPLRQQPQASGDNTSPCRHTTSCASPWKWSSEHPLSGRRTDSDDMQQELITRASQRRSKALKRECMCPNQQFPASLDQPHTVKPQNFPSTLKLPPTSI